MPLPNRLSKKTQGYLCIIFTMCVWGSFSLLSRLTAYLAISVWDIIALRFGIATLILLPIVITRREFRVLWQPKALVLALLGGVGYSSLVYSAFSLAPVAHGAVLLNGMIPVATALLSYGIFGIHPNKDTKIALVIICLTLSIMGVLMATTTINFGLGDILFVICAFCWAIYTILLKEWQFSAWQIVCSTTLWSAIIYLPIYFLLIGSSLHTIPPIHLMTQGIFHSVIVMILATFTYAVAIDRLGAFFAGSLGCLAPFISAIVAVPILHEPLNHILVIGLIGMGLGTVQPWRFFTR